jgi:hypothetical protein
VPAETRPRLHFGNNRRKPAERSLNHRLWRLGRVQTDWRVQCFGGLQDRLEEFVIEVATVLMAADDSTGRFWRRAVVRGLERIRGQRILSPIDATHLQHDQLKLLTLFG